MMLIAFDVDDTLGVSGGPIPLDFLLELRSKGHIVGLCGNWALFVRQTPDWPYIVSFLGPMEMTKTAFLLQLRTYIQADAYVMVGNDTDKPHAEAAGFRFVYERHWKEIDQDLPFRKTL